MKPDVDLQHAVMYALALDPHVDESAIGVSARHGVVTLDGVVGTYAERDTAVAIAHHVPGVHDVANELIVRQGWSTTPTDSEVAEGVRNALAAAQLPHEQIQSTVSGQGHVTLTGTVWNEHQRAAAEAAVRHIDGVAILTNLITIAAGVERGRP